MSLLRRCTPALDDFCATHCGLSSAVARSSSTNKELLGCVPFDEPGSKPERCEFYKATRTSHHHSLKRELERCEFYANNQSSSSHVLCAEDPLTLDAAQAVASRSRLAIAFLVRDAAEYIERNLWALAHLGSNFAAWRLYYLENDSTDDTRRLLDGFRNKFPMHVAGVMMDGASTQPSAFLCPPIFSKLNCLERTGLLAALRQRLLTFVLHDPTHGVVAAHGWRGKDDAILMLDIDFVIFSAANYLRSFAMARQHSAAAVFASSTYKGKFARLEVYDSAAVVPRLSAKSTVTCQDWQRLVKWKGDKQSSSNDTSTPSRKLTGREKAARVCRHLSRGPEPGMCMLRVRSGFGGFGTYWVDALLASGAAISKEEPTTMMRLRYNVSKYIPVEHVAFNLELDRRLNGGELQRPLFTSLSFHPTYLYGSGAIWKRLNDHAASQKKSARMKGGSAAAAPGAIAAAATTHAASATMEQSDHSQHCLRREE